MIAIELIIFFEPVQGIFYKAYQGSYRLESMQSPTFVNGIYGYYVKRVINKVHVYRLYELVGLQCEQKA